MRSVVVLPTYNEAENIERFLRAVRKAAPDTDVLVVDDDSPDGTGAIAEEIDAELGRITLLSRPGKRGLGSAYRDGFAHVLDADYDVVVTMDADMSHDPDGFPSFSRRSPTVPTWSSARATSPAAAPPTGRCVANCSRSGATPTPGRSSACRLATAPAATGPIERPRCSAIDPTSTGAEGYAFMTELVRRLAAIDATIVESPIIFRDRTLGKSKMSGRIIVESMMLVTRWGIGDRLRRLRSR